MAALFIVKISEEEVITISDCGNSHYLNIRIQISK